MNKFNLDIPKMGYFIVYKGEGGWFTRRIVNAQIDEGLPKEDALYTHVETSLGGQWSVGAWPGSLSKVIDITKKQKGRYIKIVRPTQCPEYDKRRIKVACWAASRCNIPYGYLGLLGYKVHKFINTKGNLFAWQGDVCSEIGSWAVVREYVFYDLQPVAMNLDTIFIPKQPSLMMPAHFLDKEYFEVVWEGVIE